MRKKRKRKKCLYCDVSFVVKSANHKFCCDSHRAWFSGGRENFDSRNRYLILERDGFQCIYCGKSSRLEKIVMCLDHIIPVSEGGETKAYNLAAACRSCNSAKRNRVLIDSTQEKILTAIEQRNKEIGIENDLDIRLSPGIDE